MKRIALLQSNYIPWKGYFDLINDVDEFFLYDEVQYTKNDWRNRNQILTPQGKQWLTIPVRHEYFGQPINEVRIANMKWGKKHWNTIKANYGKAPKFKFFAPIFEELYLDGNEDLLTNVNEKYIKVICGILKIQTPILRSAKFELQGDKNERIIDLCKKVEADIYISGPAAKNYVNEILFKENNIKLEWFQYSLPKAYAQQNSSKFDPYVTVLDYLFNHE